MHFTRNLGGFGGLRGFGVQTLAEVQRVDIAVDCSASSVNSGVNSSMSPSMGPGVRLRHSLAGLLMRAGAVSQPRVDLVDLTV
eukprot:CAMPEP_0175811876 /NCGR_PEP_ID=MMETSP0107_2-20121207/4076_1 /TAXON_ID=195067 ORGANISM="Goniomonas pacifica, Strain CCMP1869" /NCGR_SAMPLE_ID=MMETSP0107_2 /ASSEMBLY_ACC=CAM_ASM_000203 /LENGTH=82 /DNA_ID=CAMNT_0017123699 /DNA_START=200 /DNA_END=448 /DNA_ORIENTATION=+